MTDGMHLCQAMQCYYMIYDTCQSLLGVVKMILIYLLPVTRNGRFIRVTLISNSHFVQG